MTLREYLFKNRITYVKFAEIVDYSKQYISSTINGHQIPGDKFRKHVCKSTHGEVGIDDWPTELKEIKNAKKKNGEIECN